MVLGLLASAEAGGSGLLGSLGALAGLAVVVPVAVIYYAHSTWLEADGGDLRISKWGRERRLDKAEITGLACRDVQGPGPRPKPLLVIYRHGQQSVAVFDRRLWADDDFERLADALGVAFHPARRVTNGVAALEREFPGSVPRWQLHGARTALIAIGLLVLITIAVTTLVR